MTNPQVESSKRFIKDYLKPLKGAKVVSVDANAQDDGFGWAQVWPVIVFEAKDGTRFRVEVSQDEEGNGPGFLFGLPMPPPREGS